MLNMTTKRQKRWTLRQQSFPYFEQLRRDVVDNHLSAYPNTPLFSAIKCVKYDSRHTIYGGSH